MLVLSRKVGQRLVVRDDIVIELISVDRDKIRLGISAPNDVPIQRAELHGNGGHPKHPEPKA